jgi:acyl-CoA thioesterase
LAASVLRAGRTTAHVDVHARHPGGQVDLVATRALFARRRDAGGPGFLDAVMPTVPAPDTLVSESGWDDESPGPLHHPPLFDQLDLRPALGALPWEPHWEPGLPARYMRWNRYHDTPLVADGTVDPLALLPLADLPGPAVWVRYGPDEPFYFLTSLELTVHFLEAVRDPWILADFRARWLGEGYVLSECDLWSAGRLVAQANQMMLVRPGPAA